jgi:ribosomal protein S18 acetylase RimI-like enzyme
VDSQVNENEIKVEIRAGMGRDFDAILACLAAAFEPYRAEYTPEAFADTVLTKPALSDRMDEMDIAVATVDGKIVGTIAWQSFGEDPEPPSKTPGPQADFAAPAGLEGHIRGLAVLPEFAGKGIAEKLLEAAEEGLKAEKCGWITLDTTEPLKPAQRFYEKHGYKPSGQERDFFGMRLIELEKRL